ncbi:glutathione peroxidase [Inhella inkyongensis]|uniref:Glutathione peroxidase n=1 Tax=Inhella inkyongensis TaxID=392593 RepID=A0A840S0T3_9BURK|nr:glutathione peroxidase [Inhella inkyongensis]MBB5203008.1 glutathione peroxidase [Inhella inkyongensis]
MRNKLLKSGLLTLVLLASGVASAAAPACPALLQRTQPRLQDEAPQDLCQYAGKVLLIVNTASYCGFTPQYKALEALHARYGGRGLVVMGFPSNDFNSQEPGSNKEIAAFCENTFNVKFPMFAKSVVKPGQPDTNPLFAELARATDSVPRWNFHKYVVDRQGRPVDAFSSVTSPDADRVVRLIERLLAQQP